MALKYKALYENWLESNEVGQPKGTAAIRPRTGAPRPHFLPPDKMQQAINSFDPYDLYQRPDTTPGGAPYAANAYFLSNQGGVGMGDKILMASGEGNRVPINAFDEPIAGNLKSRYGPASVYEHEVGHFDDPRLRSSRPGSYENRGYTKRFGLETPMLMSEAPAMVAEDRFKNRMSQALQRRRR